MGASVGRASAEGASTDVEGEGGGAAPAAKVDGVGAAGMATAGATTVRASFFQATPSPAPTSKKKAVANAARRAVFPRGSVAAASLVGMLRDETPVANVGTPGASPGGASA